MATEKKENKTPALTSKMVEDVLGNARSKGLANQAACEVNGGFVKIVQGACISVAGMYPGKMEAQAAQAAIVVIQACGSKPGKDDLVKLMTASGQEPVSLRRLNQREDIDKKRARENSKNQTPNTK